MVEKIGTEPVDKGSIKRKGAIVAISKVGAQNRVYLPRELMETLGLEKNDQVIFLRAGSIKPLPGTVMVNKLVDRIRKE